MKVEGIDKEKVLFAMNRLLRRASFRSESRVSSSKFFHFLYSVLDQVNRMREEEIEEELEKGKIQFRAFYPPYKIDMKVEYTKMDYEEEDGVRKGSQYFEESGACEDTREHFEEVEENKGEEK